MGAIFWQSAPILTPDFGALASLQFNDTLKPGITVDAELEEWQQRIESDVHSAELVNDVAELQRELIVRDRAQESARARLDIAQLERDLVLRKMQARHVPTRPANDGRQSRRLLSNERLPPASLATWPSV